MDANQICEKYDKATATVRAQAQDYWLNSSFLVGNQWTWYNKVTRSIETWSSDDDRVQATVNRIWPAGRTTIARMLERPLSFEVLPSAPDDATIRGASTAEAVISDTYHRHRWEDMRTKNAWATYKGGTAAICVDWNPSAEGRIDNGDGESPVYKGDTVETPLSLPEFVVEPGSKVAETARWWIKSQALPPGDVKATFNMAEEPEADATYGIPPFQGSLINLESDVGSRKPELTRVLTYYERPNNSNPKGTIAVIVNKKFVMEPKPWPFPFKDKLNLALTYETEMEDRWAGETVVSMARPLQVLYNLAMSNIQEHMKNAGNARMAVPQSSINLMETFSDLPGEMFPVPDGMQVPSWISPPQMPQWWSDWPNVIANEMDNLLGVHNVSRGQAPANIESGYGLSILAEHDATPVGRMVRSQAACFSKVATMVLEILSVMAKETRTSMIRTPGDVPEVVRWTGKELQGQTEVVVPEEAIVPRSRAAQQATADKMVQQGLVQDLETYAAIAELPNQRDILDRARPDVAKARRENSFMALGRVMIPADFDDHQVHIAEHNVFRKSARYERLDDAGKKVVDDHIQAHSTMAAELAGESRAAAAIDPALAAVPQPDARPTLTPDQLPPEVFAPPPVEATPEDELAALAEAAADVAV